MQRLDVIEAERLETFHGIFVSRIDIREGRVAALGHPFRNVLDDQMRVSPTPVIVQRVQSAHTHGRMGRDPRDQHVTVLEKQSGGRQSIDFIGDVFDGRRRVVRPVIVDGGGVNSVQTFDVHVVRTSKTDQLNIYFIIIEQQVQNYSIWKSSALRISTTN